MKRVLAAVDFSKVTKAVVEAAIKIVKNNNGSLRLLHVAEPPPDFIGQEVGPQVIRDQKAKEIKESHRKLSDLAKQIRDEGIEVEEFLIQGPTIDVILNQAAKFEADLIVLGTHGKNALERVLMGSTSEGVVHKTKIPVLIIPSKES